LKVLRSESSLLSAGYSFKNLKLSTNNNHVPFLNALYKRVQVDKLSLACEPGIDFVAGTYKLNLQLNL